MWFIFRHGETKYNLLKNRIQGTAPSLLTLKGVEQSKSIAYRIMDREIDFSKYKFISSPMIRTQHSLQIVQEIIGKIDVKQILENLITERDSGEFTDILISKIEDKLEEIRIKKQLSYWDTGYPGGETYDQVYSRTQEFYEKYKNEENLIICTHSSNLKFLVNILEQKEKNDCTKEKTSQNYFICWDGKEVKKI